MVDVAQGEGEEGGCGCGEDGDGCESGWVRRGRGVLVGLRRRECRRAVNSRMSFYPAPPLPPPPTTPHPLPTLA